MTPEGHENLVRFFQEEVTRKPGLRIDIMPRPIKGEDLPYFDLILPPHVFPSMVLNALSKVGDIIERKMKNEHQTLLGRVCLHHETTYSNLSMRRTCMTFQDIAIGLRREVQFPPD